MLQTEYHPQNHSKSIGSDLTESLKSAMKQPQETFVSNPSSAPPAGNVKVISQVQRNHLQKG
jgi:hypothetical protein